MAKRPFTTLLIDPYKQTVGHVETDGSLNSMYSLIGCELVERSRLLGSLRDASRWDYAWVDEEGIHRQTAGFQLGRHPQVLMGRALVLRGNGPTLISREHVLDYLMWAA